MRKILALAVGLVLMASVSFAADAASSSSSTGQWVVQLQGGLGIPTSSQAATIFDLGFNVEALVGYAFSKDFTLGVESGIDSLPFNIQKYIDQAEQGLGVTGVTGSTTVALTHIPLELVGQYNIQAGGSVTPYILLGVGVAFDSYGGTTTESYQGVSVTQTYPNQSWTNFELDPGVGVAFNVAKEFNIFVQGKVDMDFGPTTGANGESTDSPIMTIPVQIGANLSLN